MRTDIAKAGFPAMMLKIILGLVFFVSAVLKIFDMDQFEIYIYSYHFFSLNFSYFVARVAIIAELVLGLGLVFNISHKLMWWGSVLMLLGYSLLLVYALILGRTDNCHCFGDYLRFNPWQSLIKNAVLIGLFLLIYRVKGRQFKYQWSVLVGLALACSVAVFAVNPPDNFTAASDSSHELQLGPFNEAIQRAPLESYHLDQGKKVIGFFSSSCEYCKMAAHKLSLMLDYYGFPEEEVLYVFMGSEEGIEQFFEESESTRYQYVLYEDVRALLQITNGNFPIVVMMDHGILVHEYGFRNMDEAEIKAFLQR